MNVNTPVERPPSLDMGDNAVEIIGIVHDTNDLIRRGDAIDAINVRLRQIGYENDTNALSVRQAVRDVPPVGIRTNPTETPPAPATSTPPDDFIKDVYENIKKAAAIQAEQTALESLIAELRRLSEQIQETTDKIQEFVISIPPGAPEETIKKIDRICRHNKRKGRKKKRE